LQFIKEAKQNINIIENRDVPNPNQRVPPYATNRRERLMDKLNLTQTKDMRVSEVQALVNK
jgi:hypothetical protein